MSSRLFRTAALALACSALAAGAAQAGSAECIWNQLKPARQAELMDGYAAKGPGVLDGFNFAPDEGPAMAANCKVTEANGEVAGEAFGGYVFALGASRALQQSRGLTPAALDAAWSRLKQADSAKIAALVAKLLGGAGEPVASDFDPVLDFVKLLGLPADDAMIHSPDFKHFTLYVAGRGTREARSRSFRRSRFRACGTSGTRIAARGL